MQTARKCVTADELHKLIMRRKITYEQIRRIEPARFHDLESTMRMLYDHGNMSQNGDETLSENFSDDEAKKPLKDSEKRAGEEDKGPAGKKQGRATN